MEKEKEDIYATSTKGVGEINPPRKQGEDAEGKPIKEEHPVKGHTKEAAEKAQAEPPKPDFHSKKK